MSQYQDRINKERLARQAPEVKKTAKAILDQLKDIERYLYWAIDPEDRQSTGYNCGNLIDNAHALVDLGHEYRAALKANPPPKEDDDEDADRAFPDLSAPQ